MNQPETGGERHSDRLSILALGLVLSSCLIHAFWNLLLKRARDKLAFTALFLSAVPVLYLPLFLYLIRGARIPAAGWLCVAGTAVVYFGYYIGLAAAYRDSDLSVAYPLMHGLGPALAFVGGIALLSERPTPLGACGVALILCGVLALYWHVDSAGESGISLRKLAAPSSLAALWVGLMYSLYSLIDKVGVGRLGIEPPVYIYLTHTTAALFIVPWVAARQGASALRKEWASNAPACIAVGALNPFAYLLVLYAMSLPHAPVSYIVPVRTTSVLFGVLLGVGVLREEGLAAKLGAAALMMAGIALMAWKG